MFAMGERPWTPRPVRVSGISDVVRDDKSTRKRVHGERLLAGARCSPLFLGYLLTRAMGGLI